MFHHYELTMAMCAVLSLSIWIGFSWGCLYGLVEAIPLVYENIYGWRIGAVGLAFFSVFIGAFVGWGLNKFQEKAYKRLRKCANVSGIAGSWTLTRTTWLESLHRPHKRHRSTSLVLHDWRTAICEWKHDLRLGHSWPLDWTINRRYDPYQRYLFNISRR